MKGTDSRRRVVHCARDPYDVYIGRPSQWGNPFQIGVHGTRAEVIAMYEGWLRTGNPYCVPEATEDRRQAILAALPDLRGKALGCWCFPADCHGDTLLALLAENSPDQP